MNIIQAYMIVGIPGTGKSTWVRKKALEYANPLIVSLDAIRLRIQEEKRREDPTWTYSAERDDYERIVRQEAKAQIREAIEAHRTIFLDSMNLKRHKRISEMQMMQETARKFQKKIRFDCIYFVPNVAQSIERIRRSRTSDDVNYVPTGIVIDSMRQLEEPTKDEGYARIFVIESTGD